MRLSNSTKLNEKISDSEIQLNQITTQHGYFLLNLLLFYFFDWND